jgi:hypothetical protein
MIRPRFESEFVLHFSTPVIEAACEAVIRNGIENTSSNLAGGISLYNYNHDIRQSKTEKRRHLGLYIYE